MQSSEEYGWSKPATILLATDLRDLDRLMPHALEQAAQSGAQLVLLHTITPAERLPADAAGRPYFDPIGAEELASEGIGFWCRMAVHQGLQCRGVVVDGDPAEEIVHTAKSLEAGRILMGTSRRSPLRHLLLGSVTEKVLRAIEAPVMTFGPSIGPPGDGGCGQRLVLHATRLNAASRASAALAFEVARTQQARLRLLHVQASGRSGGHHPAVIESEEEARLRIEKLAAEFGTVGGQPVEQSLAAGDPAEAILAEAKAHKADLLVLGAPRRSRLANLTQGRVLYRILTEAPCPVLTLGDQEV